MTASRVNLPPEPESGVNIVDWTGETRRRKARLTTIGDAAWKRARAQAGAAMASADWSEALPRTFAAAYEILHEKVYGVLPAELDPRGRAFLAAAASRALSKDHAGDCAGLAAYMRWVWQREVEREKWRMRNGGKGGRISPRLMFHGSLLTDWRIAKAREAKHSGQR